MNFYVKSILGFVISLVLMLIVMPFYIKSLKKHNINQEVSEYALEEYKQKEKTPIMGGLLFVLIPSIVFCIIDFKALSEASTLMVLLSYVLYCLVGFLDDYLIIFRRDNNGLSPKLKLLMELVFAILVFIIFRNSLSFEIAVPFIHKAIKLSALIFLPLIIIMYLGESNAVNFTDGMDGLCAGVSSISLIGYLVILAVCKEYNVFILVSCIIGGLFGYLKFNYHPAQIFMGDSGSIALGGLFSAIALITNSEIALLFIGGTFLGEMFCVCLQQISVRLFHKRVFAYTPIHYAFVIKGHKETTVVKRFYLLTLILVVIGVLIGLL